MRSRKTTMMLYAVAASVLASSVALAADAAKGKALFKDLHFGGGTAGRSCNSCHPEGKGLENAGVKKEFHIMGKKQQSLEEAVNTCIEMALKGKPIDPKSADMANIVAYIKSLGAKSPESGKNRPAAGGY
ncbi:MAG: hypothetical protein IT388_08315 [Nitrospirales bacterium]|nr:hypothetical protein [Nitrospirales bacterium]